MTFRRATKIVLARWPIIVAAGLLGAALALGLATLYNQSIHPRFEATAGVTFIQLDRETDSAFKARLESARSSALSIVADDPDADSLDIETDPATGVVSFIVSTDTEDTAKALSVRFRDEYLTAEPSSSIVEQITGRLAAIRTEVADLKEQIAAKDVVPSIEPDIQALRGLLSAKLSELRQEAASLSLELAVPELAETDAATLQQQLSSTERIITELEDELTGLPSPSPTIDANGDISSDLDALVLQRRLNDLQSQYIDLSLRLVDLSGTGDLNEDVSVTDRTPSEVGRRTAGAGGLVVGLIAAIGLLLLFDTALHPLRGADDAIALRSLGLVEPAASRERGRVPWYAKDTKTGRKRQIQSVRSALNGSIIPGSTLGVAPVRASVDDARLFAADLAASVAATGREVLLIDATFSGGVEIAEYGEGKITLTDLIADDMPDRQSDIVGVTEVMRGLRGVRSGSGGSDPADLVAGRGFGDVLADAANLGFAVIVTMPPPGSAVAEELTQRLDRVLLVGRAGRTTESEVTTVLDSLSVRRADPVGGVLLTGTEKLKPRPDPVKPEEQRESVEEPDPGKSGGKPVPGSVDELDGPFGRGGSAGPVSADTAAAKEARAAVATLPVGAMEVDDSLLLLVPEEGLVVAAERFLAAAVAALVNAEGGLADVPRTLVDTEGMVPITEGLGSPVAAERLVKLLPDRVRELPNPLADAVDSVLGCRIGEDEPAVCRERLDEWVRTRVSAVSNSNLWYLSSSEGTVQMLVNAKMFDAEKLRLLRAHDLRRLRVRLGRVATTQDDPDGAAAQLADATAFDAALRGLLEEAEQTDGGFDWKLTLTEAGLLADGS